MNNNPFVPQPPLPPGQPQPQTAQPAQQSQWSHFRAPPPPEQSAVYTNYDFGSQWQGQQHQYHVPPPVTQLAQPNYNSYQPTAGYPWHHISQPAAFPQPQLAYYRHAELEQQKRLHHTPPQDSLRAKRQRFDSPSLSIQAQHHAPLPFQPQFQPLPSSVQNPGVYLGQGQGPGRGDGGGGYLNNVQPSSNKGGRGRNRGRSSSRGRSARGGSMSGNRGELAERGWRGSHMDSHGGGTFGGAAAKGHNTILTAAEPAAVPAATQLHGAQNVNVSGNPTLMNIGTNTGSLTTVNNYGIIHGLQRLENFVSFAALHNSAEQDHGRRCHPGTRENVLTQLRHWCDNPNAADPIIWLHGPAGAGKSAIAQTIAHTYKRGEVAATFFFYRSDPNRIDGNRLFTTIAWQLAFSIPTIKDFIIQALDKLPHLPRTNVETQFEELVANPTKNIVLQMPHPAPVIIIDGVDECSDEQLQQRFLTIIGDTVKDPCIPLRFLIASRPEALIEETLKKLKNFTVSVDLAKLDDSNRDIQKYLEDKFSEIACNWGLDPTWPGQEIIEEIVLKSSGNFIFPSVVIRFISDEDYDPEFLLNIVRNLTPRGSMSPFALLDELFLEILKRQRHQDFLKTFLALLVARSSISKDDLHKDDAMLMNVTDKVLHTRLRRMRSLLKFEPFIDVYHKSFLDFLQDPSRSCQYHVSKEGGLKRYLELIVDSVVRHVSTAIEQPNCHGTCCSSRKSHPITAQEPESKMNKTVTEWSPILITEAQQNTPEKDLDSCLSVLLSSLQKTDSMMVVDKAMIDHMFSLLAFDYAETVARVQTISDAQKLIDLIDLLTNNKSFLSQCGPDAACKAARLASEIFARVPLLPQSLFLNKSDHYIRVRMSILFELECQSAFISRILDHNYIVPVLGIYHGDDRIWLTKGNENEQNKSVHEWLRTSSPDLVTRIRAMLEVARTIRYFHSMYVLLSSASIKSRYFLLNSNLRAKFKFIGLFAWWVREASIYGHEISQILAGCTYESNISAFADLFHEVCFKGHHENLSNRVVEDAMQLIGRCRAEDLKNRPTMKDVVTEMETWNLT